MTERPYEPLTNDLDGALLRQPEGLGRRLGRLLSHICIVFEPTPLGRRIVVERLKGRQEFPGEAWRNLGLEEESVARLLRIIANLDDLPNANFVPRDSLLFVVRTARTEWLAEQIMERMEDELHTEVHALLSEALREDWSMGRFIQTALVK